MWQAGTTEVFVSIVLCWILNHGLGHFLCMSLFVTNFHSIVSGPCPNAVWGLVHRNSHKNPSCYPQSVLLLSYNWISQFLMSGGVYR